MYIKIIFIPSILVLFTSCSLFEKKVRPIGIEYPPKLQQVHRMTANDKFFDALLKIEDYLGEAKNIHWFGHAYYSGMGI